MDGTEISRKMRARLRSRGDFLGTRVRISVQNRAKAWNGRLPITQLINKLRPSIWLRTRGSWVQILPGAPEFNHLQRQEGRRCIIKAKLYNSRSSTERFHALRSPSVDTLGGPRIRMREERPGVLQASRVARALRPQVVLCEALLDLRLCK